MVGAAISVTRRKEVLPAPVGRGINWLATERLATVRAIHVSLYKTYLHNIHELVVLDYLNIKVMNCPKKQKKCTFLKYLTK